MNINNERTSIRILVAEDESGVRNLISLALKHQGYSADFAEDLNDAAERLRAGDSHYAAVVIDLALDAGATALIEEARRQQPPVAVIALVDDSFNQAERIRADEVVFKPVNGERLRRAIQNCVRHRPQGLPGASVMMPDIGAPASVWRTEMQSLIHHVAAADIPVLIQGETGAGKEVLARQLHSLSPRSKKPFLKVNCAALPSELIESELFGYERGAFTGAFKTTPGKFEMAEGGTILLDEIGDMDFRLQAKLLQVLQDCEFIRLGSSETRKVDVRILAATHCDLERAIAENRFREDLYYRLNIITLEVPPLRDRKEDILPLVYHFMRKHATQANPAVEVTPLLNGALLAHDWPGNVRELENVIRRLLVLRRPDAVAEDLRTRSRRRNPLHTAPNTPTPIKEPVVNLPRSVPELREEPVRAMAVNSSQTYEMPIRPNGNIHEDLDTVNEASYWNGTTASRPTAGERSDSWSILDRVDQARREAESEAILTALNSTLWNRKRAAELLSIDYKALLYKMKKLGIAERATSVAI
jgi:two-component system response regulator AtoC